MSLARAIAALISLGAGVAAWIVIAWFVAHTGG
jgi:hypothetical protein